MEKPKMWYLTKNIQNLLVSNSGVVLDNAPCRIIVMNYWLLRLQIGCLSYFAVPKNFWSCMSS